MSSCAAVLYRTPAVVIESVAMRSRRRGTQAQGRQTCSHLAHDILRDARAVSDEARNLRKWGFVCEFRVDWPWISLKVPAKRACSGLRPTVWVGKNKAGKSAGKFGQQAATTPFTRSVSTDSGHIGPGLSVSA